MSLLTDIADAVVTALNDAPTGAFSEEFTAVRRVLPRVKIEDLTALTVTVWPRGNEVERNARQMHLYTFNIDIAIQKKIGPDIDGEVKTLGEVVDEMVEYLAKAEPLGGYTFGGITNEPHYSPDHIESHRAFTSIIQVTYHAIAKL